jgi:hypothetical protein
MAELLLIKENFFSMKVFRSMKLTFAEFRGRKKYVPINIEMQGIVLHPAWSSLSE